MNIKAAVRTAAPGAPSRAAEALATLDPATPGNPALATPLRAAHLIGQCAHESMGFTQAVESLYFTTPERLMAVWPRRFASLAAAALSRRASSGSSARVTTPKRTVAWSGSTRTTPSPLTVTVRLSSFVFISWACAESRSNGVSSHGANHRRIVLGTIIFLTKVRLRDSLVVFQ